MESTNVPAILARAREAGIDAKPLDTTYYLGREQLIPTGNSPLWSWRKKLFVFMSRNSRSATAFYGIPPNRVVELGAQLEF
jgi:KUP system potassium uptake protein